MGTPHYGSEMAQWAASLTKIVGMTGIATSNVNVVEVLKKILLAFKRTFIHCSMFEVKLVRLFI